MRKSEQESPLARRLRELEEEERALQQHVKEVSRKARKMESLNSEPGFSRTEPRVASTVPRPGAPPPRPAPAPGMAPRNPNPRETDRFANYFASGSFGKSRPMVRERRVMRNKAIFMLILVALVGFLVYRLAFGS